MSTASGTFGRPEWYAALYGTTAQFGDTWGMSSLSYSDTCRCSVHAQLAARRHGCYRQLAGAILGPAAPQEDLALAWALKEHAALLGAVQNITPIRPRRAA